MRKIIFNNQEMDNQDSETVLDTLIRNKIDVPFSCKTGLCRTCMLQATKGQVPESSQKDLKDTLKQQNYFLPCSCIPIEDMEVKLPNENEVYAPAILRSKEMLAPDIFRLIIEPATPLYYHAGQFLNLRRKDNLIRSYSLASLPQTDNGLELHIKRMNGGKMSQWLSDELNVGDKIDIQGPFGNCFYTSNTNITVKNDLILIGTGTGLAPLMGIIKDALHSQHKGDIYFYHGSRYYSGLYLQDDLKNIEQTHNNFHYIPCLSGEDVDVPEDMNILEGRAHNIALEKHKKLSNCKIYLCGAPPMVNSTKKTAYLAGAQMKNIYADPFELTELRSKPR